MAPYLSMPAGGAPALPSGASFAMNMTKFAPVAAVGEIRCAVVALVLHGCWNVLGIRLPGYMLSMRTMPAMKLHECLLPTRLSSPNSAFWGDERMVSSVCAASEPRKICKDVK